MRYFVSGSDDDSSADFIKYPTIIPTNNVNTCLDPPVEGGDKASSADVMVVVVKFLNKYGE